MCEMDFEPMKFLRIHSKNKDDADVQTQVWSCAFEPEDGKPFYLGALTAATCGGNSVCFIDCETGTVLAKYYTKNLKILLFSLAWTTLIAPKGRQSVLVAGGSQSTLFFFDSATKLCVLEECLSSKKNVVINALSFHPTEKQVLFCGSSDGVVTVGELKKTLGESSNTQYSFQVNQTYSTQNEVYDIAFCLSTRYLLTSCEKGLNCFSFPSKESLRSKERSRKDGVKVFVTSMSSNIRELRKSGNTLVDSVCVLKDGLIACKYALHGCIYICDLNFLANALAANPSMQCFEMEPLHTLTWSDTDNYFMYMGVSNDNRLLCCGDDKGSLWLYNLESLLSSNAVGRKGLLLDTEQVLPSAVLPWPIITDHYNDKKRKLSLEKSDIVVNRVTLHPSGLYLIGVTNNNLVCLWRKNDQLS